MNFYVLRSKGGENYISSSLTPGVTVLGIGHVETGEEDGQSYAVVTVDGCELSAVTARKVASRLLSEASGVLRIFEASENTDAEQSCDEYDHVAIGPNTWQGFRGADLTPVG